LDDGEGEGVSLLFTWCAQLTGCYVRYRLLPRLRVSVSMMCRNHLSSSSVSVIYNFLVRTYETWRDLLPFAFRRTVSPFLANPSSCSKSLPAPYTVSATPQLKGKIEKAFSVLSKEEMQSNLEKFSSFRTRCTSLLSCVHDT
jgi:hypothetical protein